MTALKSLFPPVKLSLGQSEVKVHRTGFCRTTLRLPLNSRCLESVPFPITGRNMPPKDKHSPLTTCTTGQDNHSSKEAPADASGTWAGWVRGTHRHLKWGNNRGWSPGLGVQGGDTQICSSRIFLVVVRIWSTLLPPPGVCKEENSELTPIILRKENFLSVLCLT